MKVAEIVQPEPKSGELLVKIHAAGVNPVETYVRSGVYARLPELPYTPGSDGAGRVVGGDLPAHLTLDSRVYITGSISGSYAEYCLCRPEHVHPLPEPLNFSEGAAIGIPCATAHRALFGRGRASGREIVLVHGGTGGVGIAAVQLAVAAGLRVFATGGTESGRVLLKSHGAEEVFDHHESGYTEQIMAASDGQGVDLIVEMLANVNLGNDLKLLARYGRVVVVGSRGPVEINPRDAMARDADIRGLMLANATAEEITQIHAELRAGFASGKLKPVVSKQLPLSEAPQAHRSVMSPGAHGKIVLLT